MTMKRRMLVWVMVLCLVPLGAWAEKETVEWFNEPGETYGYTWTHENQVLVFVTNEPPEAAEAFLEEFIEQRDAASAK